MPAEIGGARLIELAGPADADEGANRLERRLKQRPLLAVVLRGERCLELFQDLHRRHLARRRCDRISAFYRRSLLAAVISPQPLYVVEINDLFEITGHI